MARANFWTEKKRYGAALILHGTRGTVQVFEQQGVQAFGLLRGLLLTPEPRKFLHTVCAVKAWCLVSAFDKKYNK